MSLRLFLQFLSSKLEKVFLSHDNFVFQYILRLSSRCLQNLQHILKMSSGCLQDIFMASSRRVQDVLENEKMYLLGDKTLLHWRPLHWRHIVFAGSVTGCKSLWTRNKFFYSNFFFNEIQILISDRAFIWRFLLILTTSLLKTFKTQHLIELFSWTFLLLHLYLLTQHCFEWLVILMKQSIILKS